MMGKTSPKLKVLHIVSGDLWAGAETMACSLLKQLQKYDDLDISVILLNEGKLAGNLRAAGIGVLVFDEHLTSFSRLVARIRKTVEVNLPNIIHSHRYKENLLAFLATLKQSGTRLVSTQHGLPEFQAKKTGIVQRLISKANFHILSRYFQTVAVSEDIRKTLVNRFGLRDDRVMMIHNGIQLPDAASSPACAGPFVIGSSGRLFPVKDFSLMIEIARAVASHGASDARFELAGDGPLMPGLAELAQRYELHDSFVFKGHLDDMEPFYRGLDIYLNTSVHEGIPMTILEALGHGLPVVAPAVGGIVEIIEDGKEGFLIASRDPHEFAEKCLLLKENRTLRENMACAAREKAERAFSAARMAESYYQLYVQTSQAQSIHAAGNGAVNTFS